MYHHKLIPRAEKCRSSAIPTQLKVQIPNPQSNGDVPGMEHRMAHPHGLGTRMSCGGSQTPQLCLTYKYFDIPSSFHKMDLGARGGAG